MIQPYIDICQSKTHTYPDIKKCEHPAIYRPSSIICLSHYCSIASYFFMRKPKHQAIVDVSNQGETNIVESYQCTLSMVTMESLPLTRRAQQLATSHVEVENLRAQKTKMIKITVFNQSFAFSKRRIDYGHENMQLSNAQIFNTLIILLLFC